MSLAVEQATEADTALSKHSHLLLILLGMSPARLRNCISHEAGQRRVNKWRRSSHEVAVEERAQARKDVGRRTQRPARYAVASVSAHMRQTSYIDLVLPCLSADLLQCNNHLHTLAEMC